MAANNNQEKTPASSSSAGQHNNDNNSHEPVQDRMKRLSLQKDDIDVDEESQATPNQNNNSYREAIDTMQGLEDQIQEKLVAFRITIKEKQAPEKQTQAFQELANLRERAEEYRNICKQQYTGRIEFYTWEEVHQQKQPPSNNSNEHIVPKELPALQCIGGDHWHPTKALHLSTEMFARAFENELNAAGLDYDKHWRRLLPKCLSDAQNIWLTAEINENPDLTWQEIRSRLVTKYDTPEQQLRSMEIVFNMRQQPQEDVGTYARRFHQRCIETGLDQYHRPMIVALLSSLRCKQAAYNLVSTRFATGFTQQTLESIVQYIAGLQLDQDTRRVHEGPTTYEPRMRYEGTSSRESHSRHTRPYHNRSPNRNPTCQYCNRSRLRGHKCNEFRLANNLPPLPHLPPAQTKINRSAMIVDTTSLNDALPCKPSKNTNDVDEILIPVTIENKRIHALLDDGANFSAVDKTFCDENGIKIIPVKGHIQLASADTKVARIGVTEELDIWYNNRHIKHSFEVMQLARDKKASIGKNLFNEFGIGYTGLAFTWKDDLLEEAEKETNDEPETLNAPAGTPEEQATFMSLVQPCIDKNGEVDKYALCPLPQAVININTPDDVYCYRRQYDIPYNMRPIVQECIDKWLESGTIVEVPADADNRWNSPLTLAPKKDSEGKLTGHRPCLDPRLINQYLEDDNYSLPLINEIFDQLAGASIYTTLDLASAFHRFPINPAHQHKTAFTAPNGTRYMFRGCPFGLKPISAKFQRVMHIIFRDLPYVTTFVDDIIVYSHTKEDHAQHVITVINRLTDANLILQPKKCFFMQKCVNLLGFCVDKNGHRPDPRKITNAQSWPMPRTSKDIQAYLGFINYFRNYIPYIADITKPLHELQFSNNVASQWNERHTQAFNLLKRALLEAPILSYPNMNERFHVATDASNVGIAAVLYQKYNNRKHVISYMARALTKSERNYMITKKELLAVIFALKKYHKYLWGNKFTLYTDHKALTYLHHQKELNSMLTNWFTTLYNYKFDIVHIAGRLNGMSDALSRLFHEGHDDLTHNTLDAHEENHTKISRAAELIAEITLIPPENERPQILEQAHLFGHFGANAIVQAIHNNGLHWPNLKQEAVNLVMQCPECQKFNIAQRGYHPLKSITAESPGDHWAMDLANYELSEKGNRNLLVLVDMCTRFCILRPLPDKEATTIVNTLVQIFCDVGLPKIIQSDNGKEFVNDLMKRFARASGFEHRLVLPYHPRANGSAERWVQKVTLCIKEMLKGATTNWDSYVPAVQLALNANVTSRHKTPPFTLMFARRHNDFKDYTNTPDSEPLSEEQLLERIHHMKDIVFPAIRESTKTITKRQEAYFNRKHKMTQYNIGDYVMVRSPELSSKFDATYKGPYQIINTTNAGTSYVLKNYEGEILPRNYPPQSLKPIQVLEHIPADEIYEIESIVGHKVHKGNFLYRVRWKGYSEDDDTWEPPQNFNDPSSITTYWRRRNENPQNILERLNLKRKSSNHSHANKKARYHLRNHQSY